MPLSEASPLKKPAHLRMRLARSLCPDQHLQPPWETDRWGMTFQLGSQASSLHSTAQHTAAEMWLRENPSVQMPGQAHTGRQHVFLLAPSPLRQAACHRGSVDSMTDPNELQGPDPHNASAAG